MGDSIIELSGVSRTFETTTGRIYAVRDVTLSIGDGAFVVISGPSGSGKTSLLNLIGGLDRPSAGVITVGGRRIDHHSERELTALRRRIGFVFQSFALLPTASAYENVELGLRLSRSIARVHWNAQIRWALEVVGLADRMSYRPNELSGGQQQRVAIARALVIKPNILIADEPTGDLDRQSGDMILNLLQNLSYTTDVTTIIATHDTTAVKIASTVLSMTDGRVYPMYRPV